MNKKTVIITLGMLLLLSGCAGRRTEEILIQGEEEAVISEERVSEDTVSEESIPEESVSEEGVSEEGASEEGIQGEIVSGETPQTVALRVGLEETESRAKELEERLGQDSNLTQTEMNMIAEEIYQLWDDKLNEIWGQLRETLDEESMAALTEEERAWISDKEAEVEAAGAGAGGGSTYPLITGMKAAELTKVRVYELAEILEENAEAASGN